MHTIINWKSEQVYNVSIVVTFDIFNEFTFRDFIGKLDQKVFT